MVSRDHELSLIDPCQLLLDLHDLLPSVVMVRHEHTPQLINHLGGHLHKLLLVLDEELEAEHVQLARLVPPLLQHLLLHLIVFLHVLLLLDHVRQFLFDAQHVEID